MEVDADADSEEADWSTDDDESDWETRLLDQLADHHPDDPEEDLDWDLQDDIHLTPQAVLAAGQLRQCGPCSTSTPRMCGP